MAKLNKVYPTLIIFSFVSLVLIATIQQTVHGKAIKVEIVENNNGGFSLLRGGVPYQVKGVGITDSNFARVVELGANSLRTWSIDDNGIPAQELLDRAHALGLTVSLCLPFNKERYGFDFNNSQAVDKLIAETVEQVEKYKNHPALLTWIIGNEINYDYKNPKVFDALNKAALKIKEIDPNHPTTTALAGFDKNAIEDIEKRAPALDFISFQMYASLMDLPKFLKATNFTKPYFVTEWGAVGHWEVHKTSWGAPVENTSSEKAKNYLKSYHEILAADVKHGIGNYVFLWGQKQEKTPTWYGMFLKTGEHTETIDVMYNIWTGKKKANLAPQITPILINGKTAFNDIKVTSEEAFTATFEVIEPDNDNYQIMWEIRKESTSKAVGGDPEYLPQLIATEIKSNNSGEAKVIAPKEQGAYRLFAYIYDGEGNAAHANFPFYVKAAI